MSRASHVASFCAGMAVAAAIGAGATPSDHRPRADRYRALDTFAQALAYVTNDYVDPVDEVDLLHDATRGMMAGLDRHSQYFSPRRYQKLRQDTEGEYASVGLVLGPGSFDPRHPEIQPWPYVDDVIDGSPAARAGLAIDDRIVAVDGQVTAAGGKAPYEAGAWEARLRGASGTRVKLTVWRAGWPSPREVSLVRAQIKIPSVKVAPVEPGVGYVSIRRFQEATSADVATALGQLEQSGHLHALILDLRDDPGGLLDQAVKVADDFLPDGLIVTIRGRHGGVEEHVAHQPGTWSGFPIFCLVDGGSASAAEILAGALQDRGRATIIGTRSYGKGSVQTFFDLDDGAGLKLTTARYYTPSGRSLEGTGITPNIEVGDFAPIEVVAGKGGTGSTGSTDAGPSGGEPPAKSARILGRLSDDPQLARAIQEARRARGSK